VAALYELRVVVPADHVETFCDAFDALEALSVSVEDADAQTDAEQALFGEPGMPPPAEGWNRSRITALFDHEGSAREAQTLLQAQDFAAGADRWNVTAVADQDWVRLTQSQFAPVMITPEFWIVPSWHEPPAQAKVTLRLDPGLAFGTGTHPTTRMCLRWIASQSLSGQRVLDYGCGSGILAMAAHRFGARDIDAVDIDPAAVESTLLNIDTNATPMRVGLPEVAHASYDLVVANILASPLKVLAPLLCGHMAKPHGRIIMAGILDRQEQELREAYAPYVSLQVLDREDGWILMGCV